MRQFILSFVPVLARTVAPGRAGIPPAVAILLPLLLASRCAIAQSTRPTSQPSYDVIRTSADSVNIDGKLDDAAWADAPWTGDFIDILGPDHPAPPHRTRAKIVWTDAHLFVAVELSDPDVRASMTKRGSPIHRENCFEIFLDPDGDGRDYWEIEVNALNGVLDLKMSRPYRDGGRPVRGASLKHLRTAVQVDGTLNRSNDTDRGWTVEIAVPLAELGVKPKPGDAWRINLARIHYDGETAHLASWSPLGARSYHTPERFGRLVFK